ncbi:hypothetical protein [Jatrophihabitans sp.]|uniref:hypothetical protein n=1 Tax=Jatrophihabitans sp. TaxID=1932789 RepID=UPI002F05ECFA
MKNNRTKAAVLGGTLAAGAALALLSPASPAWAYDSDGLYLAIAVQSPATLVARGAAVDVTSDVACTSGHSVYLDTSLKERVGSRIVSGSGYIHLTCTGSLQRVVVRVIPGSGTPFARGTAVATANIYGCVGTICGQEMDDTTIEITK